MNTNKQQRSAESVTSSVSKKACLLSAGLIQQSMFTNYKTLSKMEEGKISVNVVFSFNGMLA